MRKKSYDKIQIDRLTVYHAFCSGIKKKQEPFPFFFFWSQQQGSRAEIM